MTEPGYAGQERTVRCGVIPVVDWAVTALLWITQPVIMIYNSRPFTRTSWRNRKMCLMRRKIFWNQWIGYFIKLWSNKKETLRCRVILVVDWTVTALLWITQPVIKIHDSRHFTKMSWRNRKMCWMRRKIFWNRWIGYFIKLWSKRKETLRKQNESWRSLGRFSNWEHPQLIISASNRYQFKTPS